MRITRTDGVLPAVLVQSHHLPRPLSKLMGVDDESSVFGDFVIQRPTWRILYLVCQYTRLLLAARVAA